jgi:hypothetical protein
MKSWGINIEDTNSNSGNLFFSWWERMSGIGSFFCGSWFNLDVKWRIISLSNLVCFINSGWVVEFFRHGNALGITFNAFTEWSSEWGNLSQTICGAGDSNDTIDGILGSSLLICDEIIQVFLSFLGISWLREFFSFSSAGISSVAFIRAYNWFWFLAHSNGGGVSDKGNECEEFHF